MTNKKNSVPTPDAPILPFDAQKNTDCNSKNGKNAAKQNANCNAQGNRQDKDACQNQNTQKAND